MLSRECHLCSLLSLPHTNNKLIISLRTWTDIHKLIVRPLGGDIVPATLRGRRTHLISNLSCSRIKSSNGFTTNTKHTLISIREEQDTQSQCVYMYVNKMASGLSSLSSPGVFGSVIASTLVVTLHYSSHDFSSLLLWRTPFLLYLFPFPPAAGEDEPRLSPDSHVVGGFP